MNNNELVRIPKGVVDEARQLQKRLMAQGRWRALHECIEIIYSRRNMGQNKKDLFGGFRIK